MAESTLRLYRGKGEATKARHFPFIFTLWGRISGTQLLRKIVCKPRMNFIFVQTWCLVRQSTALDVLKPTRVEFTLRKSSGGQGEHPKVRYISFIFPRWGKISGTQLLHRVVCKPRMNFIYVETWFYGVTQQLLMCRRRPGRNPPWENHIVVKAWPQKPGIFPSFLLDEEGFREPNFCAKLFVSREWILYLSKHGV